MLNNNNNDNTSNIYKEIKRSINYFNSVKDVFIINASANIIAPSLLISLFDKLYLNWLEFNWNKIKLTYFNDFKWENLIASTNILAPSESIKLFDKLQIKMN